MSISYKLINLFKLIFRTISSKFLIILGIIIASTVALPILYLVIRSVNSFTEVLDLTKKLTKLCSLLESAHLSEERRNFFFVCERKFFF